MTSRLLHLTLLRLTMGTGGLHGPKIHYLETFFYLIKKGSLDQPECSAPRIPKNTDSQV